MSRTTKSPAAVVPAQLSFLAIYNPSLGSTDETLHDQIVFYSSRASKQRKKPRPEDPKDGHHQEENEKLRQIGLAQGMVEFARGFSEGEAIDSIETEKSRIIVHELEPAWWILVSIDLTRLTTPLQEASNLSPRSDESKVSIEYSSREVSPPALLLQQICRAHEIFLLHHAPSLSDLWVRVTRERFCAALEHFWSQFLRTWDVLLHGNPAVDVYDGLKLAAGGELGIGVGEEDWGSGEREVLEGFIERTEGLEDLVVSRFGEVPQDSSCNMTKSSYDVEQPQRDQDQEPWLGSRACPAPQDGIIFSGVGAISRQSLKTISKWMEWLYIDGEGAYGVSHNPNSTQKRRRRNRDQRGSHQPSRANAEDYGQEPRHLSSEIRKVDSQASMRPGIPPPIVTAAEDSLSKASDLAEAKVTIEGGSNDSAFGTENVVKYLTFGLYGSSWGIPAGRPTPARNNTGALPVKDSVNENDAEDLRVKMAGEESPAIQAMDAKPDSVVQDREKSIGRFLIGLQGDLENDDDADDNVANERCKTDEEPRSGEWNSRIVLRTLHIQRVAGAQDSLRNQNALSDDNHSTPQPNNFDKCRVVIYVHQPFVFTFLFSLRAENLAISSFYRSIHHQLGPLQRPLLNSTSPANVSQRLCDASNTQSTTSSENPQPLYDLVYDPSNLTIHTSLPNIPESVTAAAEGLGPGGMTWTRMEALNVHSQILNTYASTRRKPTELERTCKTSRGWWVVWMRLSRSQPSEITREDDHEAILIRRASDYMPPPAKRNVSGLFFRDVSGSSAGDGWGPGKLAEGIGIDARKYIEGLLSLNR